MVRPEVVAEDWLPQPGETPRGTLARLCEELRQRLGAQRVGTWLHDPDARVIVPFVFVGQGVGGPEDPDDSRYRTLRVDMVPMVQQLLSGTEPAEVADARGDPRIPYDVAEQFDLKSFLAIPLSSGATTALLTIEPLRSGDHDEIAPVLPYLAAAASHALAWRDADQRRRSADLLLELMEVASGDGSLDDVLATLCQRLATQLRARRASIFLVQDGDLVPRMSRYADGRMDKALWEEFRDPEEPSELVRKVIQTGETVVVEDAEEADEDRWWAQRFGIVSVIASPIGQPPDATGVIVVDSAYPRRFSHEQVRFVTVLGSHVGGVLRRARDDEQRALNLRIFAAVERILEEGAGATSIREAAAIVAQVAHESLETEHAVAFLRDARGDISDAIAIGIPEDLEAELRERVVGRRGPLAELLDAMDGPGAVLVEDAAESGLIAQDVVERAGLRSFAAITLYAGERPIGLIECGTSREARRWTPGDEQLLRRLADEGALVVENAALRESEQRRLAELSHRAFHDALTGLPNRALLLDRISQALARSEREPETVAIAFVDLDRFKEVNDSLGHEAGDQLLVEVAERLRESVRPADTVARLAGDEFVVVLEEIADRDEAIRVADRITEALHTPFVVTGHEVRISGSVGIVLGSHEHNEPEELVRRADLAMYRAKRDGGDHHELFDARSRETDLSVGLLEDDLRQALSEGGLELRFQPFVHLDDGAIAGVEVVTRWRHPRLGVLPAQDFFPLAQEIGVMTELGRWVFTEATSQTAAWSGPAGEIDVAINLSGRQLYRPTIVGEVRSALEDSGLGPERVIIEVTEDSVAQDVEVAGTRIRQMKELGVRVALDDYGTGQSSLAALRVLPVDILKIERTFVDGVATEIGDAALVRAIIDVGASLGLTVIAEGVETRQQRDALRELGCKLGQGFLFGHPMQADDLVRLVERRVRWG